MTLIADVNPELRLQKTWLDQCLKSLVSDDPSKSNLGNALKICSNLKDTSFTIFIDHCEGYCHIKSLSS